MLPAVLTSSPVRRAVRLSAALDRPAVCQPVCGDQHPFALPVSGTGNTACGDCQITAGRITSVIHQRRLRGCHIHTGGKRQRGDPGERATVGDTVLTNRDMVAWTVPLLSSELPSRGGVPAESRLPRLSVLAAFSVASPPAHDIAGTGQLTGCRSSKVTGCQHGATVRPVVRLHGEILSLRGPAVACSVLPRRVRSPAVSQRPLLPCERVSPASASAPAPCNRPSPSSVVALTLSVSAMIFPGLLREAAFNIKPLSPVISPLLRMSGISSVRSAALYSVPFC